ncbi:MAG: aspartate ammonia-lyase [Phycisphaerales bacterium]|nr:aspartate ammonia-lyase [Phycisphaerales bacterium]
MSTWRRETDLLGACEVPAEALYGIHTVRALRNFPLSGRAVHPALAQAYGEVKRACVRTNRRLGYLEGPPGHLSAPAAAALESACAELARGDLWPHIVVDALQGGAGTSLNMNVNEVLANRALQLLGRPLGEYATIDPHAHANLHQSTNDTFPTALRVAAIARLRALEGALAELVAAWQEQEQRLADVVKVGRTELQDAVLTTLGRSCGAFAEAFGRDRWRIYKCEERLRTVNLGGTAIGTGLGAPRDYLFAVVDELRALTGFGLARAENLVEATQNADAFVEVSGLLKACATNLLKVSGDLRWLGSGPQAGLGELRLPALQAGSSIMPGKVNPVVPEAVTQAALRVCAHDQEVTQAVALGNLELNAFLPLVADALLESVDLLERSATLLRTHVVAGLAADRARCALYVESSTATLTALVGRLGYEVVEDLAQAVVRTGQGVRALVVERGLLTEEEFAALTAPEAVLRLGAPPGRVP